MTGILNKNKNEIITILKDMAGIFFGCAIGGLGLSLFLIPFKASPGGAAGVAQIFFYFFNNLRVLAEFTGKVIAKRRLSATVSAEFP